MNGEDLKKQFWESISYEVILCNARSCDMR